MLISSTIISQLSKIKNLETENKQLREHQSCEYHDKIILDLEQENLNLKKQLDDNNAIKEDIKNRISAFFKAYYTTNYTTNEAEKRKDVAQYVNTKTYQQLYPYPISEETHEEGIDYSTSITINKMYIDVNGTTANVFVMSEYSTTIFEDTTNSSHIFDCTMENQNGVWIITEIRTQNFVKLL